MEPTGSENYEAPPGSTYNDQVLKRIRDDAVLQQVYSSEYQDQLAKLMANHLIAINTRYLYEPQIQRMEKDLRNHATRLDCMNKTIRKNEQILEPNQLESLIKNKYRLESKLSHIENLLKQLSVDQSKYGREIDFIHNHIRREDEDVDRLINRVNALEDHARHDQEIIYGLQQDVEALSSEMQPLKEQSRKDGDAILNILRMLNSVGIMEQKFI